MRHSIRRGFTLIELLVVMGIILVLIAIVVMGMRHVNNTAARYETTVELKTCMDMLKEYQGVNGLNLLEADASSVVSGAQPISLPNPPWQNKSFVPPLFIDEPPNSPEHTGQGVQPSSALGVTSFAGTSTVNPPTSGGAGDMGDKSDPNNPRWSSDAVAWSQCLMYVLLKDPKNRDLVSKLPPKRILEGLPSNVTNTGVSNGTASSSFSIVAALPLDGWGNPIVFVPRGGMHVLMDPSHTGTPAEYVVRTSGVYLLASLPSLNPSDHPFFASAGQDGYFVDLTKMADRSVDNVYSFQEQ